MDTGTYRSDRGSGRDPDCCSDRATEPGAIAAAIGSFIFLLAIKQAFPQLSFMDQVAIIFALSLVLAR